MTIKDIFELRKQGRVEEAYEAIRPMYRVHKGRYTTLCMFWVASDIFKKRMDEGRTDEARKNLEALKRMQPRVEAITKELDAQSAATPAAKLPWEKTDQQPSAASAFISYASHCLAKATATVPAASPVAPVPAGSSLGKEEYPAVSPLPECPAVLPQGCPAPDAPVPDASPSGGKECPAVSPLPECPAVLPHGNSVPYAATPLQPNLQRLLDILKGDMSVREMMSALNFHSRDKFLKNYLSPALKAGLVEMTDPNSPKSPKQRYRKAQGDK